MKKEGLTLIIGILIGAIISTGVFLVLKNSGQNNTPNMNNIPMNKDDNNHNRRDGNFNTDENSESKSTDENSSTE